jgi:glycosyltransferase involved in cell wall biosynthesis
MNYTVIIPTHNRPDLLVRALKSVYVQSRPAAEIIVVDDGSKEPIVIPAEFSDPRIRLVRIDVAGGAANARNAGLAIASGEVVAFLDDDDEWLPEKMARQIDYLRSHPACALVSCGCTRVQNGRRYDEVFTEGFVGRYGLYDTFVGSFSFMAARRKPDGDFLMLDPKLPAFQDWDYFLKMRLLGEIGVVEESLVIYNAHVKPRITNSGRNRLRGLRRCFIRHRSSLPADSRKWVLSRLLFERAQTSGSRIAKARWVIASIFLGLPCRLPAGVKFRAIGKRLLNLAIDVPALENFRANMLAVFQRVARVPGRFSTQPARTPPVPRLKPDAH